MLHRFVAETIKIDYNVLSVAALTLALIMIVEYLRHLLDYQAKHRPFFRAVLEGVYAELATLGFVSFIVYLIEEYYPSYDKSRKIVFADVHFLFFYTAILNAILSVCTSVLVIRASKKEWIQTESLELNHFVEIRETFSLVKKKLEELRTKTKRRFRLRMTGIGRSNAPQEIGLEFSHSNDPEHGGNSRSLSTSSDKNLWDFQSWGQIWASFVCQLRYPALNHQYYSLLKQIRFHELREHIIQSYGLPNHIKISDYLMRSERMVLMKLVNVSSLSWLLLSGAISVMYFIFGIVFYEYGNQELIGTALTYIYFFWMGALVIVCWILSMKIMSIFNALMHSEDLWDVQSLNAENKERLALKQLALFWYKQPSFVVKLVQFMQFGYATALSTLIVFWKDIRGGSVNMVWFPFTLICCYILFVLVAVQVLPRFTLCTSLGQLVDERRLRETLALFRLEEAKQKVFDFQGFERDNLDNVVENAPLRSDEHIKNLSAESSDSELIGNEANDGRRSRHLRKKSISDGVAMMAQLNVSSDDTRNSGINFNKDFLRQDESIQLYQALSLGDQLSELVKEDMKAPIASFTDRDQSETNGNLQGKNETVPAADKWVFGALSLKKQHHLKRSSSDGVLASFKESSLVFGASPPQTTLQINNAVTTNTQIFTKDSTTFNVVACKDCHSLSEDDCCSVEGDEPFSVTLKYTVPNTKSYAQALGSDLMKLLHLYFLSERHIEISNVFGAVVAFFLVGQRVEGFVHSQNLFIPGFVSFNFDLDFTFWMLTAWLCMFLLVSALILIVLGLYGDLKHTKGCRIACAAMFDSIISAVCLTVLFVAEYERCCIATDLGATSETAVPASFLNSESVSCSCPKFGSRLFGGLGTIEPYTSLVLLRVFRHWLAQKLIFFLQCKYGWFTPESKTDLKCVYKLGVDSSSRSQVSKFGGQAFDLMNSTLMVTEAWEAAIGSYPDVAALHGEFSSEILRLMLGVAIPPNELSHGEHQNGGVNGRKESLRVVQHVPCDAPQTFSLSSQYSSLSPEAQAAILAGKLGQPIVRSSSQPKSSIKSSGMRPSLPPRAQSVMFEIDKNEDSSLILHQNDSTSAGSQSYNFISPNARLIRSMRRCDRKFLPLLESWAEVDVVVTRFEIVYLDVNIDETNNCDLRNGILQAIRVTKGGKGLRLCDVVAGRRVAGRVVLSDVSSLRVVRHLPVQENEFHLDKNLTWNVGLTEYWKAAPSRNNTLSRSGPQNPDQCRSDAWKQLNEDHLMMGTIHGHHLILRFYADLDDAIRHREHHMEKERVDGIVFENNALQWVQTIGRFCGSEQLKQQFSHSNDFSSILSDYLVIVDRSASKRGVSHRRIMSDMQRSSFRIQQLNQALSWRGFVRPSLIRRTSTLENIDGNNGQPNVVGRIEI